MSLPSWSFVKFESSWGLVGLCKAGVILNSNPALSCHSVPLAPAPGWQGGEGQPRPRAGKVATYLDCAKNSAGRWEIRSVEWRWGPQTRAAGDVPRCPGCGWEGTGASGECRFLLPRTLSGPARTHSPGTIASAMEGQLAPALQGTDLHETLFVANLVASRDVDSVLGRSWAELPYLFLSW